MLSTAMETAIRIETDDIEVLPRAAQRPAPFLARRCMKGLSMLR